MAKKRRSRGKNRPPPPPPVEFKTGDLVLAKMKGFPWWPARIATLQEVNLPPKPGKFPVIFFGDESRALLPEEKLLLFVNDAYGVLPERTHYERKFAEAVAFLRLAIKKRDAVTTNETPPGPEPFVQETLKSSPESMRDLILKAKSKRDWTLDRTGNEFVLETMKNNIKILGCRRDHRVILAQQAMKCGKSDYVTEILSYLVLMIQTSSTGHKLSYLYLLDGFIEEAFKKKDPIGQKYLEEVEKILTQIFNASMPIGSYARANRNKFLKVLKKWRQKEIFTSRILDQLIGEAEQSFK